MDLYNPEVLLDTLKVKINEAIDKLKELPVDSKDYTTCMNNLTVSVQMYASFIPKKEDKDDGITD